MRFGLSILSGAHMALVPRVLELLKANGQSPGQGLGRYSSRRRRTAPAGNGCDWHLWTQHLSDTYVNAVRSLLTARILDARV